MTDVTTGPAARSLDFSDGTVRYFRQGTGRPLLFLHAAGGAAWDGFLERLSAGHDVVAPAHPGFAPSDEMPGIEDMGDLVYHYIDLIERLGLDRPHLVGGSLGGWVAAELAVAAPHLIGSLTLMGAVGLRIPEHPVTDLFFLKPHELPGTLFKDPAIAAQAFPPGEPDIETIIAINSDMAAFARYAWAPFCNNPKLERRLRRINVPTLVVWADSDAVVPIEHGHRYAERIAGARFEIVENCGHAMYGERPDAFVSIVSDFLSGVAR